MNKDVEESIDLAVKILEKHILKLIQQHRSKRSSRTHNNNEEDAPVVSGMDILLVVHHPKIYQLLQHTRHLLLELFRRRYVLQSFLEWFHQEWTRLKCHLTTTTTTTTTTQHNADSSSMTTILQILEHTLQQFVRCQDGLVLLTSGECRHPYDIQMAKQQQQQEETRTKFPSRLSTLSERKDGYTKLYTGIYYSGFGWDEFHNEQVGIQVLLIKELKKYHKSPWEYLESKGATDLMESLLDQHECAMKEIQQTIQQSLKQRICDDIQTKLKPCHFKFVTQDKMERLSMMMLNTNIHNNQSTIVDLQRRANAYQILHESVLPPQKQHPQDWNTLSLTLNCQPGNTSSGNNNSSKQTNNKDNTTNVRKRRRRFVIDSSDSSSDTENNEKVVPLLSKTIPKSTFKNHHAGSDSSSHNNTTKKHSSSFNSTGLLVTVKNASIHPIQCSETKYASVRDIKTQLGVNANELEHARMSLETEGQSRSTINSTTTTTNEYEANVQRLETILKRVMSRKEVDQDEIWDARECLRMAHMEAGNYQLWEEETTMSSSYCINNNNNNRYDKAKEHFGLAESLTKQQLKAHQQQSHCHPDFDPQLYQFVERNLLYLQGQATANIGIAMIESIQSSLSVKNRNKAIKAIPKLEAAKTLASKIRGKIHPPFRSLEELADLLKADQLESLSCRWIGKALWMSQQENRAIHMLERAYQVLDESQIEKLNMGLEEDVLDLAAESIYAIYVLVDLTSSKMEHLARTDVAKGNEYMGIIERTLQWHNRIIEMISKDETNSQTIEQFLLEKDISTTEEINQHLQSISEGWNKLKNQPTRSSHETTISRVQRPPFQRADLSSSSASHVSLISDPSPEDIRAACWRHSRENHHDRQRKTLTNMTKTATSRHQHGNPLRVQESNENNDNPSIQYQPWGDELFWMEYDKKHGKVVADKSTLPYPFGPPPMPEEFQRGLDDGTLSIAPGCCYSK